MSSSHDEPHIFDHLRDQRIIFVRDPLDMTEANRVIAELLHLEGRSPLDVISVRVSSSRVDLPAALAVYDSMQAILAPMATLCAGTAAGGAALLVAAGTRGQRAALPSAQFLLQQPKGKLEGHTREIDLEVRRLLQIQVQVNELLAKHTGQPLERIERDMERGLALGAEEARAYGLIDSVANPSGPGR